MGKRENYIPVYEYCMSLFFSKLSHMGSESASVSVPEFSGNVEEAYEMQRAVEAKLAEFSCVLVGLPERDKVIEINDRIIPMPEYFSCAVEQHGWV